MRKFPGLHLSFIILAISIVSCSNTPNSITINPDQNSCVQSNMYSSLVTPSPLIANNPQNAPYCMSVTIQNNNSGLNANNIQITNGGLSMTYSVGSTNYSSQMYDPVAAGISIPGANQVLGNIEVFDPENCLTNSGANVDTINANGQSCTFYMQILSESDPVGAYPINLTYNYTNGNNNYSISTNIYQRVNLFAGGSTGLYLENSGTWISGGSLHVPIQIPTAVTSLARDIYGNIYISTSNLVYRFNGVSTTQVANAIPGIQINGITTDLKGSAYIATNQGIWKYSNTESNAMWLPYDDLSPAHNIGPDTNVVAIKSYENFESTNVIYATTESQAFVCNTQSDLNNLNGCHWSLLTGGSSPNIFLTNALVVDFYNNLYTANESSVNTYVTSWQNLSFFNQPGKTTGIISTVFWLLFNNTQYLYVGENNALFKAESAVYLCNPSPINCGPIQSVNGNPLIGNVYAVAADGANNLYAVGNGLNSADFESASNAFGAFLNIPESGFTSSTVWTPISNGSPPVISGGALTVLKISSMLTSY